MVVEQKKRRREGTDTDQGEVKALRQEVERLREERARSREGNEGMKIAKLEAGCQTPEEKDKDVKLPTEMWAIIAGKLNQNDVCPFALVSKQLREAQVLAGRELVTRPVPVWDRDEELDASFTQDWCAYWSRKFNVHQTDPEVVKHVLYVAARHGYLQVFEKYWSQGPQEKLSKLWNNDTCGWAALHGHLEVIKWLWAKGCPWGIAASANAAYSGHLEVLQWMRGQDPPCPWNSNVCYFAALHGHLEILRWARSQGCPWNECVPYGAAEGGHLEVLRWARSQGCPWNDDVTWAAAWNGHLEVLRWARSQGCPWDEDATYAAANHGHLKILKWLIKEGCPYDKRQCRRAAVEGGECARNVLDWLNE